MSEGCRHLLLLLLLLSWGASVNSSVPCSSTVPDCETPLPLPRAMNKCAIWWRNLSSRDTFGGNRGQFVGRRQVQWWEWGSAGAAQAAPIDNNSPARSVQSVFRSLVESHRPHPNACNFISTPRDNSCRLWLTFSEIGRFGRETLRPLCQLIAMPTAAQYEMTSSPAGSNADYRHLRPRSHRFTTGLRRMYDQSQKIADESCN